ncbi:type II toxin-antitoxin system HipA family toxin YjjJ [Duganella sp. FT135W]|uniref:Type II toxin-antitoxin system HipA family toxin YjjJ n=1 Tax=Duganella flavida TaxID=2692175 RepID=A0A6L8KCJ8_9BURK|nr:type II toxin-antitoxin system HipA family toxin YjjJ [Duganella flavida]
MRKTSNADKLDLLLKQGPEKAAFFLKELDVSKSTFSRLWTSIRGGVVLGAGKARQYASRRHVSGVDAPIPVFRVSAEGRVDPIGYLDVLQGEFYAMTSMAGTRYEVYKGTPFFFRDLRPQGFLGRMAPGKHRDLDLQNNILRWTDEQVLQYISKRSENAVGDLILGNESYARYINSIATEEASIIADENRALRYPVLAQNSMQGEAPAASAGGEQPKFTAVIRRQGTEDLVEHVIVKFSPKTSTPSGRRWGDLLICEHLALAVLARNGIAAAQTSILELDERVFLEVVRFDRAGLRGRCPMASFSALDGDLGMMDQNWTAVARELGRMGELPDEDIVTVEILDLFGSLIGNTDKHHGNIAVAWTLEKKHRLLDAYDMLPMLYRPNSDGEIVDRVWTPAYLRHLELKHLPLCYGIAIQFWSNVLKDSRISDEFKGIAYRHLEAMKPFTSG